MLAYIARRTVLACGTILAISVVAFVIIQLPPGDYLTAYIATLRAQGDPVSMEQVGALRKQYGLDRPITEQYGLWMWNMLHGDFGVSLDYNRPVSELIGERFSVDRSSGIISGFELSNEQAQERMVIDKGSNKQAFKVLSVFEVYGPYQGVKYLHIEEFAQTPEKAFFAVSGSWLLTGHCTR